MRCICCNTALSDFESTRKSLTTGEYYDMCNKCFKSIKEDLFYKERPDLITEVDVKDLEDFEDNDDYYGDYEDLGDLNNFNNLEDY